MLRPKITSLNTPENVMNIDYSGIQIKNKPDSAITERGFNMFML
jgi:hypothetical protein